MVLAAAVIVAATAAGNSCTSTTRAILAPPEIPGAEFVGSDTCAVCHEDLAARFVSATHARLEGKGENAANIACESCHGPGSLHAESAGEERGTIVNPRRSPEACMRCHLDVRADFALPYAHPVTGGPLDLASAHISCADCHDPHEGRAVKAGGTEMLGENELCLGCHVAQRGPFVFEHEALREGCTVCHRPHGSVNEQLLTERHATLCLKCHAQEQTADGVILIGGRDHSAFLTSGTCFSAGCHEAIHGSQVSSSLRF